MTDVFFSYSSKDREKVRAICDGLSELGFEVFWDQSVPAGMDWDTWIRQHLSKAKCVVVLWSTSSIASDNVRHEAAVAKQQGKLLPVLIETLSVEQFPMGLYAVQCAKLASWTGDKKDQEWLKLTAELASKLTPPWAKVELVRLEAELVAERARRAAVERRDQVLQDQIAREAEAQVELKRERDRALEELAAVRAKLGEARQVSQGDPNKRDAEADARYRALAEQLADERRRTAVAERERDALQREVAEYSAATQNVTQYSNRASSDQRSPKMGTCPQCRGTGRPKEGGFGRCFYCGGGGRVPVD